MGPGPGWPTRTRMCGRQHALGERDCPGPAASPRWPLSVGPAPLVFLTRISRCQCDSTRTRGRCLGPAFCEPAGGRRPRRARGLDHSHWRWRWHPLTLAGRHAGTVTVTPHARREPGRRVSLRAARRAAWHCQCQPRCQRACPTGSGQGLGPGALAASRLGLGLRVGVLPGPVNSSRLKLARSPRSERRRAPRRLGA